MDTKTTKEFPFEFPQKLYILYVYLIVAGHRAHTMYVGVHLPGEKRHRKHKHSRANSRDSDEEERPSEYQPLHNKTEHSVMRTM